MNLQPDLSTPSAGPNTRLGTILRVGFFAACVYIGARVLTILLFLVFGITVAGAVGLCATGLLANLLTMRIFDRRPFADIGLELTRASALNFSIGLTLGAGVAALMLVAPLLAGTGHIQSSGGTGFNWPTLAFYMAVLAVAAMGEEMIFRGYAFQLLIQRIGPFATVLPAAVVFGFAHISNPHASFIAVTNTILWGIVLGFAFLRSHDLWLPIGLHFGWNVVLPLFGVNLSGLTIDVTRFSYRWDLLPLWSGGDYGPEGGLLATIFIVGLFFALLKSPVRPQRAAIADVLNEAF